jgi:DNA-binding response OmpR family regulator
MDTTKRPCILAVDDDPVVRQTLLMVLSRDYELVICSSGMDLKSILDGVNPDMAILDVNMPVVNGYDLCRSIRSVPAHRDIPIIFLSSYYGDRDVVNGIRAGADYYMSKPFHSKELRRVVAACLEGKVRSLYKSTKERKMRAAS